MTPTSVAYARFNYPWNTLTNVLLVRNVPKCGVGQWAPHTRALGGSRASLSAATIGSSHSGSAMQRQKNGATGPPRWIRSDWARSLRLDAEEMADHRAHKCAVSNLPLSAPLERNRVALWAHLRSKSARTIRLPRCEVMGRGLKQRRLRAMKGEAEP
jgi:hypothetical protein